MNDDIDQQVADLDALNDEVAPEAPEPQQPQPEPQAAGMSLAQAKNNHTSAL